MDNLGDNSGLNVLRSGNPNLEDSVSVSIFVTLIIRKSHIVEEAFSCFVLYFSTTVMSALVAVFLAVEIAYDLDLIDFDQILWLGAIPFHTFK